VKQDPLALAFFGAALAVLAGLLLYVFFLKTPEPATPDRAFSFVEALRRQIADLTAKYGDKPAAKPVPPAVKPAPPTPSATASSIEAGRTWRYNVVVEPPAWRDATLTYRTKREGAGIGVLTEFVHAAGKMEFHLGTFAAWHPSHANVRFPGFFMYPSYFRLPLQPGQDLYWSWPWQPAVKGRMKRYVAKMLRWEDVQVPAGIFRAAVIEARLFYVEFDPTRGAEQTRVEVKETLWYAPQVSQLVKVVREGRSPDEGSSRIVAELAEYR
jgi:hypothetical protein